MPCKTIGGSRDIKPNQSHLDGWSTFHPGLPPPFMGRLGRTLQMLKGRYSENSKTWGTLGKGKTQRWMTSQVKSVNQKVKDFNMVKPSPYTVKLRVLMCDYNMEINFFQKGHSY